ncbi:MAG: leucyl/phenylalanyl-tRNA--protein transferase [Acidimicrobiales bacterium]
MATPRTPPATRWRFPQGPEEIARCTGDTEVVAIGADLEPGTVLAAYQAGIFPMPWRARKIAWWSPDPRGILPLDSLRISRSLRKAIPHFEIRIDSAFEDVIAACAGPSRTGAWIDKGVRRAYTRLHRDGWAHSVEAWADGELAGGLYGLAIGGLFAGESMFHRRTDASKVALVGLVERLRSGGATLLDVQWLTPHLASLGAVEVARPRYHDLLAAAVAQPQMTTFA